MAARLDRSSEIEAGTEAELWLDGRAVHLFDPESGRTLLGERAVDLREHGAVATDSPARGTTAVAAGGRRD